MVARAYAPSAAASTIVARAAPPARKDRRGPCSAHVSSAGPTGPPGSVIHTGPDEPNLRVVRELDTENDDPEMHFTVRVVEPA